MPVKLAIVVLLFSVLAYPSIIHKLWADATAQEVRRSFESLPAPSGARAASTTEQFSGLYDPTGTDGTYIIGWFGSSESFEDVSSFYQRILPGRGWVAQDTTSPGSSRSGDRGRGARAEFRDNSDARMAHYELLVAQIPGGSRDVPAEIANQPTVFALRLGVVDPRATTQVAWFIDCLVRRAPTFPTCEATGWNPIEQTLSSGQQRPLGGGL